MAELDARYAAALFDLAIESKNLSEYVTQSVFLRDALQTENCRNMMEHPAISAADKHLFIQKTFAGQINDDLLGFLYLVVARRRENILIPVLNTFIEMGKRHDRMVTAEVVTALALNESQVSAIQVLLSKKMNKQVEINLKTDPSVIGGLCVYVDGYLLDFTIKQQLSDMTNSIKRSWQNEIKTG